MSKREASQIAVAGVDIDAPRAKRRKEVPATADNSLKKEQTLTTDAVAGTKKEDEVANLIKEDPDAVKEKGLKLWQMVKDAVNKEGRILSHDFMRLPSKRQYPDYYQQIRRPIALDEIKAQLDAAAYASFEDVKQDFDTCFRNAKRYNMRESQIWKDAKYLHKLVNKEYSKMTGTTEDAADAADDGDEQGANGAGSDDEGGKKKKSPNMNRLLKTRLQKLVEKTDESGRVLSTEFMDLPNRKQWPIYYKTIKRPQCLENIFKHLKRKEYHTSAEFANDVELVFSNAIEFNQDHTEIWDDAMVLREYFRQLMSDLPPPYAIPAYASTVESPAKIKLKVPAVTPNQSGPQTSANNTSSTPVNASPSSGTVRIPAQHHSTTNGTVSQSPALPELLKSPATVPKLPQAASPSVQPTGSGSNTSVTAAPVPTVAQLKGSAPTPVPASMQPAAFTSSPYAPTYTQHYPNATYQLSSLAPVNTAAPSTSASVPSTQTTTPVVPVPVTAASQPQTPSTTSIRQPLRLATLITKPLGRRLELDYRDGVKTWAMRLCGETGVRITGVVLQHQRDEDEETSDEEGGQQDVREEEEEEPKAKRGRGRPRKQKATKSVEAPKPNKGKAPAKAAPTPEELQLKLNGVLVRPLEESQGEWNIELPVGSNIVELGEKGGVPWRVYLDRIAS